MKILLCDRLRPGETSGPRVVDRLERYLSSAGHEVEQVLLPYADDRRVAASQMMAFRHLALAHSCERLIAFGAPTYVIVHPKKVIWCHDEPSSLVQSSRAEPPQWLAALERTVFGEASAVFASDTERVRQQRRTRGDADFLARPTGDDVQRFADKLLAGAPGGGSGR